MKKNIRVTKNKKLKKKLTVDEVKTEIVNKINTENKELLDDQKEGGDSTDGVVTLFEDIIHPILEEFQELIGERRTKRILYVVQLKFSQYL